MTDARAGRLNGEPDSPTDWWVSWGSVYALNLFLPGLLGLAATTNGGRIGMVVAVVVGWGLGQCVCAWPGHPRSALLYGARIVALLQMLPIPQVASGAFALHCWSQITGSGVGASPYVAELRGFAVTLMTAFPLMMLALALGYFWRWANGYPGAARDEDSE